MKFSLEKKFAKLFLIFSFLPLVAVPLGTSSNLSICCILAAVGLVFNTPHYIWKWIAFLNLLLVVSAAALIMTSSFQVRWQGVVYLFMVTSPLYYAMKLPQILEIYTVFKTVLYSTIASSLLVFVQYFFFNLDIFPILSFYDVSGYPNYNNRAVSYIAYSGRPFGLFPESSFMAATVLIAIGFLTYYYVREIENDKDIELAKLIEVALLFGCGAIILARSGGVIVVPILFFMAFRSKVINKTRITILTLSGLLGGLWVFEGRSVGSGALSWSDRLLTLNVAANEYLGSSTLNLIFGMGRESGRILFQNRQVEVSSNFAYGVPTDVTSVLFRLIFEQGLIGVLYVLFLMGMIISDSGVNTKLRFGLLCTWIFSAGIVTTYESAAWIWILPGIVYSYGRFSRLSLK